MVRSASEYLFLTSQDSFPEEAFQECYAMKHEEELCVRDEMRVTRSEKTGRLESEATTSCLGDKIDQCSVYTLGQDAREREVKDGVELMDTVMAENSVTEDKDEREDKDEMEDKDDREEKDEREDKDDREEKDEREDKDEREEKDERENKDDREVKNNVDKKLWNAILCGLRKKTRNLKLLPDKLWRVISIVGQNTEILLNNINSYNVSFGI